MRLRCFRAAAGASARLRNRKLSKVERAQCQGAFATAMDSVCTADATIETLAHELAELGAGGGERARCYPPTYIYLSFFAIHKN